MNKTPFVMRPVTITRVLQRSNGRIRCQITTMFRSLLRSASTSRRRVMRVKKRSILGTIGLIAGRGRCYVRGCVTKVGAGSVTCTIGKTSHLRGLRDTFYTGRGFHGGCVHRALS